MTQTMTTATAREAAPEEPPAYEPVTPGQARRNRRVLDAALREHDRARKLRRRSANRNTSAGAQPAGTTTEENHHD